MVENQASPPDQPIGSRALTRGSNTVPEYGIGLDGELYSTGYHRVVIALTGEKRPEDNGPGWTMRPPGFSG